MKTFEQHFGIRDKPIAVTTSLSRLGDRIRAKYPVLRDGSLINVDGQIHAPGDAFSPRVVSHAMQALRGQVHPDVLPAATLRAALHANRTAQTISRTQTHRPDYLRKILLRTDKPTRLAPESVARITVLEITPLKMYAHWHVPAAVLADARQRLADTASVLTMRFRDITGGMVDSAAWYDLESFDIDTALGAEHQYLTLWAAGRSYVVELGLRATDGRFVPLARSQAVSLPRDTAGTFDGSDLFRGAERFRTKILRPASPPIFHLPTPTIALPHGIHDWALRDVQAEQWVRQVYAEFVRDGVRVLRNHAPIRPRPAEILRAEFTARQAAAARLAAAPATTVRQESVSRHAPPDFFLARLDTPRPVVVDLPTTCQYPLMPMPQPFVRILRPAAEHLKANPVRHAWRDLCALNGQLERWLPSVAVMYQPVLPPPAGFRPQRLAAKPQGLLAALAEVGVEMEAEIILRGRVKPGRKVRIGGQIISTAADGSFRVSCIIKDGKLHVPIEVVRAEAVVASGSLGVTV